MRLVDVKNIGRRPLVANLAHHIYCEAAGRCGCTQGQVTVVDEDATTGERHPRTIEKRICAVLRVQPGCIAEGLDPAVAKVPEVAAAVRGGTVRIAERIEIPEPIAAPTEEPPNEDARELDESRPRRNRRRDSE